MYPVTIVVDRGGVWGKDEGATRLVLRKELPFVPCQGMWVGPKEEPDISVLIITHATVHSSAEGELLTFSGEIAEGRLEIPDQQVARSFTQVGWRCELSHHTELRSDDPVPRLDVPNVRLRKGRSCVYLRPVDLGRTFLEQILVHISGHNHDALRALLIQRRNWPTRRDELPGHFNVYWEEINTIFARRGLPYHLAQVRGVWQLWEIGPPPSDPAG